MGVLVFFLWFACVCAGVLDAGLLLLAKVGDSEAGRDRGIGGKDCAVTTCDTVGGDDGEDTAARSSKAVVKEPIGMGRAGTECSSERSFPASFVNPQPIQLATSSPLHV
jgi:hypothetical protein